MLLLKILGALAAVGLGIWLGLPGSDQIDREELEKVIDDPERQRRRVKRRFTPLDLLGRSKRRASLPSSRPRFRMHVPEEGERDD